MSTIAARRSPGGVFYRSPGGVRGRVAVPEPVEYVAAEIKQITRTTYRYASDPGARPDFSDTIDYYHMEFSSGEWEDTGTGWVYIDPITIDSYSSEGTYEHTVTPEVDIEPRVVVGSNPAKSVFHEDFDMLRSEDDRVTEDAIVPGPTNTRGVQAQIKPIYFLYDSDDALVCISGGASSALSISTTFRQVDEFELHADSAGYAKIRIDHWSNDDFGYAVTVSVTIGEFSFSANVSPGSTLGSPVSQTVSVPVIDGFVSGKIEIICDALPEPTVTNRTIDYPGRIETAQQWQYLFLGEYFPPHTYNITNPDYINESDPDLVSPEPSDTLAGWYGVDYGVDTRGGPELEIAYSTGLIDPGGTKTTSLSITVEDPD